MNIEKRRAEIAARKAEIRKLIEGDTENKLNMVNAKLADKYQTGADGETPPDDPKKEKDPPPTEPDGGEAKEA